MWSEFSNNEPINPIHFCSWIAVMKLKTRGMLLSAISAATRNLNVTHHHASLIAMLPSSHRFTSPVFINVFSVRITHG